MYAVSAKLRIQQIFWTTLCFLFLLESVVSARVRPVARVFEVPTDSIVSSDEIIKGPITSCLERPDSGRRGLADR